MKKHVLGFPRIGVRRELKKALEAFWRGEIPIAQLNDCAKFVRLNNPSKDEIVSLPKGLANSYPWSACG